MAKKNEMAAVRRGGDCYTAGELPESRIVEESVQE